MPNVAVACCWRSELSRRCPMYSVSERKIAMVPRVTMKGAILPLVTRKPFRAPRLRPGGSTCRPPGRCHDGPGRTQRQFRQRMPHGGDEGRHRADGEVDAAADDDEGHAQRDDPRVGDLAQDVEEVLGPGGNTGSLGSRTRMNRTTRARREPYFWRSSLHALHRRVSRCRLPRDRRSRGT